jgi:tetratricopeptide (TPR) repeat protein
MGRFLDAEPVARDVYERRTRVLGDLHPATLDSAHVHASALLWVGRLADAEAVFESMRQRCQKVLGDRHSTTILATADVARMRGRMGQHQSALSMMRRALEAQEQVFGKDHPQTLAFRLDVAWLLMQLKQTVEAEGVLRESLEGLRRTVGPTHPESLRATKALAQVLIDLGPDRYQEATSLAESALTATRAMFGDSHNNTLGCLSLLGVTHARNGFWDRALPAFQQVHDRMVDAQLPPNDAATYNAGYAIALSKNNKHEMALPLLRSALPQAGAAGLQGSWLYQQLLESLIHSCAVQGLDEEADKWRQVAASRPTTGPR